MSLDRDGAFSYLLIRLVLCFSEKADVLDESGLDVFVVHKLTEDVKLLPQELVGEIHLTKGEGRCATGETNKTCETCISEGDPLKHAAIPINSPWCS